MILTTDAPQIYVGRELNNELPRLLATARYQVRILAYEINTSLSPSQHGHQPIMPQLIMIGNRRLICKIILAQSKKSANVRITNTRAAEQLIAIGWEARIAPAHPLQHAKCWLLDNHTAIIGSHNLTISSLISNVEVTVSLHDTKIIARLSAVFGQQWEKSLPP